jgi:NADPH-dependent curcumin reductase CurA
LISNQSAQSLSITETRSIFHLYITRAILRQICIPIQYNFLLSQNPNQPTIMSTHPAVVTASVRGPLEVIQVPTVKPSSGEVLVRVEWTSSTPLDLHQNDGGLLVKHPQVLGDGIAGTVVEAGPNLKNLKLGDKVSINST